MSLGALPPASAADPPLRLAVMDLKPAEGVTEAEARSLTGLLRTALHQTGAFTIINREDMERIAENYGIELTVCGEEECLMKLGTALGAQRMVVGDVGMVWGGVVVNARLVDVTTDTLRNVLSESEITEREISRFPEAMRRLAEKLAGGRSAAHGPAENSLGGRAGPGSQASAPPPAAGGSRPGEVRTFDGIEFIWIPPGSFEMGSPSSEPERDGDEGPVHHVTFREGFWLGRYEVTQAQWLAVVGSNPSSFQGDDRLPVENVSWNDIQEFLGRLNRGAGRDVYRLPSEAEWEYACRAGTITRFSTGNCISTSQANYDGNYPPSGCPGGEYRKKTVRVGSFSPNAWDLYEMHGNVWEWCGDAWHDSYQGAPADGSTWTSGGDQSRRVLRGGSWIDYGGILRSAYRFNIAPTGRPGDVGFRLARTP